jgi:hypothetical protein
MGAKSGGFRVFLRISVLSKYIGGEQVDRGFTGWARERLDPEVIQYWYLNAIG